MTTTIDALWDRLATEGQVGGALRVDEAHPCDLYASLDAQGRPGLVAVVADTVPQTPMLDALTVSAALRGDGRVSLGIWLNDATLRPAFAHLCQDLIDASRSIDPDITAKFLITRLGRWRRLLRGASGLSLSEVRGLVGELLVLRGCLATRQPEIVVGGWYGPLDGAQDFIFPDLRVEVKVVQPDARTVTISSADQLDSGDRTVLVVVMLKTVSEGELETSLDQLVTEIHGQLESLGSPQAAVLLDARLAAGGYFEAGIERGTGFRVHSISHFEVAGGFPRIGRSDLPLGVADIRYDLELGVLAEYKMDASAL